MCLDRPVIDRNGTEPTVSVIVPVYNVLPYLREALDSVIHQTYSKLEIVIVDDGSTDGSGAVCDEYKSDARVRVIHQENRGLSGARNTGLDLMTGEYVSFLDSDDAFYPEMIETMLAALIDRDADMVSCGYAIVETEGKLKYAKTVEYVKAEKETVLDKEKAFSAMMEGRYTFCVWNKLYRKKLWESFRFSEGAVCEDIIAAPRILEQCGKIAVVPLTLICYRKRTDSITSMNTIENVMDRINAYEWLREYLENRFDPLPAENNGYFREKYIREMIFAWAELKQAKVRLEMTNRLKSYILEYTGKGHRFRDMKSKAAWMLFRLAPGVLISSRACFRKLKRRVRLRQVVDV